MLRPVVACIWPLVLLLAACQTESRSATTSAQPLEPCLDEAAAAAATQPAGFTGPDEAIVPMGRRLTPVGTLIELPYFPIRVAFSANGSYLYVVHSGRWQMEAVEVASGKVVAVVPQVGGFRALLPGLDAHTVYTGDSTLGTVSRHRWVHGELVTQAQVKVAGTPTDLVLTADGSRLIAVSASNSAVFELEAATLKVLSTYQTRGIYPYAVALTPDEAYLLTTHVGDDTLSFISRDTGEVIAEVPVGLNPMGLAVDETRNRAYVCNSDSDSLSVVDLASRQVVKQVDLSFHDEQLPGGSPNEIVLDSQREHAYISFADLNRVEIFRLKDWRSAGALPTAHYPTGVALSPADDRFAVASSKGWGGALKLKQESCPVQLVELPVPADRLAEWTQMSRDNVDRTTMFWDATCPDPVPRPLEGAAEPVIEHVVLIVRENKTYDAVLGDFERGNGDPELTVFGELYTPNLHELARQFVNLDNYYADSQESFQGHTWTTQADCNDFFEKLYPSDIAQVLLAGIDPSSIIAETSIFDHLFSHGLTFRNYGEAEGFTKGLFDIYKDYINHKFPYYNLAIKDVWKAEEFIRELDLGIFPDFVYIALPNDHTAGGKVGFPTPASMVADNDEATGMIVEAISHSPYWDSTVIFIIEDDPQGYGGDHVHAHRSVCVVISPWVRRAYTSSVHYSIPALYRTFEMLLRIPPMHKNDAFAPPMYDIFVTGDEGEPPDFAPFVHIPRRHPEEMNPPGGRMGLESANLDLSRPDASPGMGYILWRIMKGDREPPPYAKWNDK